MQYMMMIRCTHDSEAGGPPNPALMAGMAKLAQEMVEKGLMVFSAGLQPSSQGMRIQTRGGQRTVTDGPFTESKELIAGFAILKANSREEALELAYKAVDVHTRAGVDIDMEVRPVFDPSSMGPPR